MPSSHYSPDPNIMERTASAYLRSARGGGPSRRSALQPEDLAALRRIRRATVAWAILSGTVSGAIIGGTEMYVRLIVLDNPDSFKWREHLPSWAIFYAYVGVVTVVEITFLHWNALRAIVKIGATASVPFDGASHSALVTSGLARSALGLPNPQQQIYGVDPYALISRWRLLAQNALYKTKVGATSFILRVLMRRVLARAVLRGYIPLLSIPLYATWNAIITWRVMSEAWIRALGPFVVDQIQACVSQAKGSLHEPGRDMILQGVGEMIRRGSDAHPSHVLLLSRLIPELGTGEDRIQVDWASRRKTLQALTDDERSTLLAVLTMTSVLAGKPRKAQRAFLREVHSDCGVEYRDDRVETLRKELTKGRPPPSA
jgi:hypothetical protein